MQILFGIQQNTTVKFTVRLILLSNVKPGIIDFFSNLGAVHNSDIITPYIADMPYILENYCLFTDPIIFILQMKCKYNTHSPCSYVSTYSRGKCLVLQLLSAPLLSPASLPTLSVCHLVLGR